MAELADALVLGASGQPCGFESHYPHGQNRFFRTHDKYAYLKGCCFIDDSHLFCNSLSFYFLFVLFLIHFISSESTLLIPFTHPLDHRSARSMSVFHPDKHSLEADTYIPDQDPFHF